MRKSLSAVALSILSIGTSGCGFILFDRDRCENMSSSKAAEMGVRQFSDGYSDDPKVSSWTRAHGEVVVTRVSRDHFGDGSDYNSINVHFGSTRSSKDLITLRIFPDCELEWVHGDPEVFGIDPTG